MATRTALATITTATITVTITEPGGVPALLKQEW